MNEDETCVELLTLQLFPPVKINLLLCIFSGLRRWIWASWYRLESSLSIGTTVFVDNRIDSWTALTTVLGYPLSLLVSVNNGAECSSKSWGKRRSRESAIVTQMKFRSRETTNVDRFLIYLDRRGKRECFSRFLFSSKVTSIVPSTDSDRRVVNVTKWRLMKDVWMKMQRMSLLELSSQGRIFPSLYVYWISFSLNPFK